LSSCHKPVNTTFIIVEILHSSDVYYSLTAFNLSNIYGGYGDGSSLLCDDGRWEWTVAQLNYSSSIDFWVANTAVMPTLAPLALDIISAPALQAYVERVFSVCGDLITSKRNRMSKNLYMRVSEDEQQVLLSTCLYSSCSFCWVLTVEGRLTAVTVLQCLIFTHYNSEQTDCCSCCR